jgi:hypothetical protein
MGGGEQGEDRSSLKDNFMANKILFEKGGHGTSLFYYSAYWVPWVN